MQNKLSTIALEFMKAGLTGDIVSIPEAYKEYVEVFDVPEKPDNWEFMYRNRQEEIIVPVSGGLDSTICYYIAKMSGKSVRAFYVDMGQEYAWKEKDALVNLGIDFSVLADVRSDRTGWNERFSKAWKHILPARNFYILSLLAEQAEGPATLYFGVLDGEIKERLGGDKSKEFLRMLTHDLARMHPFPVTLELPIQYLTKASEIEYFLGLAEVHKLEEFGINNKQEAIDLLTKTVTCFDGTAKQCGRCQACLRRYLAFEYNGIKLDDFDVPVMENTKEFQMKYLDAMTLALRDNDFSQYSKIRCEQDLHVLKNNPCK